jgi:hypothetical protein
MPDSQCPLEGYGVQSTALAGIVQPNGHATALPLPGTSPDWPLLTELFASQLESAWRLLLSTCGESGHGNPAPCIGRDRRY